MLELWNSDDVAAFLRMDVKHFNERIKPLPDFPRPGTLPMIYRSGKELKQGRTRPLWDAAEVRTWVAQNRAVA